MKIDIATKEDLQVFKTELLEEIKKLLSDPKSKQQETGKKWLKSHQVQRLLGISSGTLQTFVLMEQCLTLK